LKEKIIGAVYTKYLTLPVADDFIRVDLAPRSAVKIGNSGRRNFQTFQFLLGNRVSDRRILR